MNKTIFLTAALAVLSASPIAAEQINVTVVAGHPSIFRWVRMIPESFVPAVEQALEGSGHTLNFTGQYGGAIAGVGEELETVGSGLAEIGTCQSLFDPAKLALQNVTYYTPFVSSDIEMVSATMDTMNRENAAMIVAFDDNDVVYLGAPIVIDDYLLMTDFPVSSLADLEGRKIAAPGAAVNWLSGTGAVGVSGNLTTYYNEIKTNVYDGVLVFASAALPSKLYEVAPHITRVGLGAQFSGALCANKDWFASQSDDVQAALKSAADTAGKWYSAELTTAVEVSFTKMAEAGATITDASDDMRQAWASGMDNAAAAWTAKLDAGGLPASETLSEYMNAMRTRGATPLRNWEAE